MTRTADEIKGAVKEHYGERAKQAAACCGTPDYRDKLYVVDEVADLPETVASYGCGNPTAIAGLREGEVGAGPRLRSGARLLPLGEGRRRDGPRHRPGHDAGDARPGEREPRQAGR